MPSSEISMCGHLVIGIFSHVSKNQNIKFKEYKDGKVKVEMQGSCSGCPSSTMTLKQGVENLLKHYIPEIKEVIPV